MQRLPDRGGRDRRSCSTAATASSRSCGRYRDYTRVDAVVISHLHADHFLDLVPFSYALTYAPRQQPMPVDRWPGTDTPGAPEALRAAGATELFRRVVGAWGNEDLIENAFEIEEFRADSVLEIGSMRFRFHDRPALHRDVRDRHRLHERRRPASPTAPTARPTTQLVEFARGTDLLIVEATLPRPERTGSAATSRRRRRASTRSARGRQARAAHARVRRARRALGAQCAKRCLRRPDRDRPRGRRLRRLTADSVRLGRARASNLARMSRSETPSRTSSACAARSTSCSATSGRGPASRTARAGFSPARSTSTTRGDPPKAVDQGRSRRRRHRRRAASRCAGATLVISGRAQGPRRRGPRLPADRDRARARSSARSSSASTSTPSRRAPPTTTASCASSSRSRSRGRRAGADLGDVSRRKAHSELVIEITQGGPEDRTSRVDAGDPAGRPAGAAAAGDGRVPEHGDAARRRPGALGASSSTTRCRATACS